MTLSAQAGVVTGTIGTINSEYGIDFNNDGTFEFKISDFSPNTNSYLMFDWSDGGNNIWTNGNLTSGGWDVVKPLTANTSIGASGNWEALGDAYIVDYSNETIFPAGESYIGFRFKIGGNTHYGWAKVSLSGNSASGYQVQWLQCAYESTPNTAIAAGSTGSGSGIRQNNMIVSAAPNPTAQAVRVCANVEDASHVLVFDMSGKLVNAPIVVESEYFSVNFSDFRSGIYFVKFDGTTIRIVKE